MQSSLPSVTLHALSALFTRDIYSRFLRRGCSEREKLWSGQSLIFVATAVSLALVLLGSRPESNLSGLMQMIVTLALFAVAFSIQLLPMTLDVLFIRRGTRNAAIISLTCGLLVAFCFTPLFPLLFANETSTLILRINAAKELIPMHASAWGLVVNGLVFVAVSVIESRVLKARSV